MDSPANISVVLLPRSGVTGSGAGGFDIQREEASWLSTKGGKNMGSCCSEWLPAGQDRWGWRGDLGW